MKRKSYITLFGLIRCVVQAYSTCHLSRSAAAVAYYLLLALLPMTVCFSVLLYRSNPVSVTLGGEVLSRLTLGLEAIGGFSWENPDGISSTVIFGAALALFLSASAGAFRCLGLGAAEITEFCGSPHIDNCHQKHRYSGILGTVIGYLFATLLFFAVYAAIFLLLLWEELTALIVHRISANVITELLSASHYLVLFWLFYALCFGLLRILPPHLHTETADVNVRSRPPTAPGALFCTIGLCAATVWFALFIRGSAKYSLVYGSLASMILLLTWIFICGNLLLLGIAVNAAITK